MTELQRHLLEAFPLDEGFLPIPEDVPIEPKWILAFADEASNKEDASLTDCGTAHRLDGVSSNGYPAEAPGLDSGCGSDLLDVRLQANERLTSTSHWQDVRKLVFTSSVVANYAPGDIVTVFPQNPAKNVNTMLQLMGWNTIADQRLIFVPNGSFIQRGPYPPRPMTSRSTLFPLTLRRLLTNGLDINAIPKRSFFSMVAHFTIDAMQKERLLEFVKPEYIDELYDYTTRPRRSILEVLEEFDTVKIPWQWAINVLPELRGRQFSIASGGELKIDDQGHARFELLVAIVRYKTVIKKIREGVCTRYLASLAEGSSLNVTLQKGSLGVSEAQVKRPLVLIGPGTGIAPIRSLIWERLQVAHRIVPDDPNAADSFATEKLHIGRMALFFGCRKKDEDFFYQEEWQELQTKLPLQVFTAFSRDQKNKIYVQDLIKEQFELIYHLLFDLEGMVYVCGSSGKMPKAVRMALAEAFARCGQMHQGDAEAYLQTMEKEGRYKQETW